MQGKTKTYSELRFFYFSERMSDFSLKSRAIDRRISSGQEGKWFYALRTTRGHQFLGVSTNSVR